MASFVAGGGARKVLANVNRNFVTISIYYGLIFMAAGAYGSYIGLYYTDVGFDTSQIGLVSTLSAVMAIMVQPYWGLIGDRSAYKNNVLVLCMLITSFSIWLIPLSGDHFGLLIGVTLLITVFQCSIFPMSTTVTLEIAGKNNFKFSSVRTFGSVGFALMSLAAGWVINYGMIFIFVMYSSIMLLALSFTPFIAKVKGHQREGKKLNLGEVFKNRKLMHIFIYAMFIQATISFYFSFQAIYSKEMGISTGMIGLGLMVGSVSQFPFIIFFDKIYKALGITKLLLIAGLVQAVRLVLFAYVLHPGTILLLWVLHGGTVILIALSLVEFVNASVVPELKASGQMLNAIVMQGLSTIVGSLAGGILARYAGLQMTFVLYAGVCLLVVTWFWLLTRKSVWFRPPRVEQAETVSL